MSVKIGFAIVSHNEPEQLLQLVKTLNAMFGAPPIVCHHDFSRCSLQQALFPTNVSFVHPHIFVRWGHISLPLAALRAFSLLRKYDQPDWIYLLSGSDYPVRPVDEIVADLSNPNYDAYLDNREIVYRALPPGQTAQDGGFGRPSWIPLAYGRYCTWRRPTKTLLFSGSFLSRRRFVPIRNHRIDCMTRWFQFNRPSRIYGGDFWFHANRKAIDRLLDDPSMKRLVRYYRTRELPEESLFHTALCNQADLRICKDHKRYEDWTSGGAHPKWLDMSDVPKIIASGAHFARKIRDAKLLEFVETTLLRSKCSST
jgi:core-2/I-Branching enzyme